MEKPYQKKIERKFNLKPYCGANLQINHTLCIFQNIKSWNFTFAVSNTIMVRIEIFFSTYPVPVNISKAGLQIVLKLLLCNKLVSHRNAITSTKNYIKVSNSTNEMIRT